MPASPTPELRRGRRPGLLSAAFVGAMLMGAGPGLWLIDPAEGEAGTWWGIPVLYAWAWLWFAVLATLLVLLERRVWSRSVEPIFAEGELLEDDGPGERRAEGNAPPRVPRASRPEGRS